MTFCSRGLLPFTLSAVLLLAAAPVRADLAADIATVKLSGGETPASPQVQAAWKRVTQNDSIDALLAILQMMEDADAMGVNALRMAFDATCERMLRAGVAFDLREQALDRTLSPKARTTAFDWAIRVNPASRQQLISRMLDDPAPELRYAAVEDVIARAEEAEGDAALPLYREAFSSAIDVDQKQRCAKKLDDLGESVELAPSLGYVLSWRIVGPFDNVDGVGFAEAYEPEQSTDAESFRGKEGEVSWVKAESDDDLGVVDLTKVLGPFKGAVAYAEAVIDSPASIEAELRYSTRNATKAWVNGQQVHASEAYHSGHAIDQFIAPCRLQQGKNRILLKLCQNEQTEPWAQSWEFQCRLTDPIGAAAEFSTATGK